VFDEVHEKGFVVLRKLEKVLQVVFLQIESRFIFLLQFIAIAIQYFFVYSRKNSLLPYCLETDSMPYFWAVFRGGLLPADHGGRFSRKVLAVVNEVLGP
jgi:hypothetical protein